MFRKKKVTKKVKEPEIDVDDSEFLDDDEEEEDEEEDEDEDDSGEEEEEEEEELSPPKRDKRQKKKNEEKLTDELIKNHLNFLHSEVEKIKYHLRLT